MAMTLNGASFFSPGSEDLLLFLVGQGDTFPVEPQMKALPTPFLPNTADSGVAPWFHGSTLCTRRRRKGFFEI
jgi:hypothetical protein